MRNLKRGIGGAILLVILFALPAQAEWVTIHIDGIVDSVSDSDNYLEGKAHVGDTISGWYTFDTSTSDFDDDSFSGRYRYYSSPAGVSLHINDLVFETNYENVLFQMAINNDRVADMYRFDSMNNIPLKTGANIDLIFMELNDPTKNALSNDSLPLAPPNLNLWQNKWIGIWSGNFTIGAHVTSIVPEPATLIFLSVGFLGIHRKNISRN